MREVSQLNTVIATFSKIFFIHIILKLIIYMKVLTMTRDNIRKDFTILYTYYINSWHCIYLFIFFLFLNNIITIVELFLFNLFSLLLNPHCLSRFLILILFGKLKNYEKNYYLFIHTNFFFYIFSARFAIQLKLYII